VTIPEIKAKAIDCPGFFDNRSAEINIANAINIKATAVRARGLVVVVLLNYFSLLTDKARGLNEIIETLFGIFGGPQQLTTHLGSVLLGVSHAPRLDGVDGCPVELGHIQVGIQIYSSSVLFLCSSDHTFYFCSCRGF